MLSESGFVQILTSAANDAADPQLTQQVRDRVIRVRG
jgi:hypothetical protein